MAITKLGLVQILTAAADYDKDERLHCKLGVIVDTGQAQWDKFSIQCSKKYYFVLHI